MRILYINLIQKFESTGSVDNVKPPGREKTVRTVENRGLDRSLKNKTEV